MNSHSLRRLARAREAVVAAALAWDEAPGDSDLCLALSDACAEARRAQRDYDAVPL